jgi:hypothetical protein
MHGFDAKIVFDPFDKSQAPDSDRFRPAFVARTAAVFQRLLDPLAVCPLKISQIRKATQLI